jgi:hypothetical protein
MTKTFLAASAVVLTLALPVAADPAVGFGLSLSFGGGKVDAGVGVRLFSNDEEDSFAATLGLDYMLKSGSLQPTVGAAYVMDSCYIGLDLGLNLNSRELDFGVRLGGVKTEEDVEAAPVDQGDLGDDDGVA